MEKSIVILGGAGFIGSHLSRRFFDLGYKVKIVDDFSTPDRGIEAGSLNKMLEYRRNLIKGIPLSSKLNEEEDVDYLVNLAADPVEYSTFTSPQLMQFNRDNSINLDAVRFAYHKQIPYFFMSSIFALGNFDGFANEEAALNPCTVYGMVKAQGEQLAKTYLKEYTIVRTTSVYGMGDINNRATSIIMRGILNGNFNPKINMSMTTNFTYINDLVEDLVFLITEKNLGTYNIVGRENLTLKDYCDALSKVTGYSLNPSEFYLEDRPRRGQLTTGKIDKLRKNNHKNLIEGVELYWKEALKGGTA